MKDWILSHKKVYFFIVGLIAFVSFMVITLIGFKKTSHAATQTVTANDSGELVEIDVYDIREVSWDYWLENTQDFYLAKYDNPENLANDIISECNYLVVVGSQNYLYYYFYVDPFYHNSSLEGQNNIYVDYDNGYRVEVSYNNGNPRIASVCGMFDNASNDDNSWSVMYNGGSNVVGSTYDFLVNCEDSRKNNISRNNLTYPVVADYIFDLDYTFDDVYYRQSLSTDDGFFWTLYFDREPDMVYPSLQNYYIDVSYRFVLPSLDLLQDFADIGLEVWSNDAVDLWRFSGKYKRTYDYQASYLAPQGFITLDDLYTNLREDWQSFYGTALDEELLYLAVRYAYPQVTAITYREIGTDGNYHMGQTAVLDSYEYYTKLWNGLIMPSVLQNVAVNTHGVSLDYIIPLADVSAKNDYDELLNQYQQEVNKNKEFEDALKDAQSEVQRAEEALKKAHEDMGLSGFLDIFDNIAEAFESASGALTSIASAIGAVFSFMPSEITGCLYFVFVFLLFVAIYKAIRG